MTVITSETVLTTILCLWRGSINIEMAVSFSAKIYAAFFFLTKISFIFIIAKISFIFINKISSIAWGARKGHTLFWPVAWQLACPRLAYALLQVFMQYEYSQRLENLRVAVHPSWPALLGHCHLGLSWA